VVEAVEASGESGDLIVTFHGITFENGNTFTEVRGGHQGGVRDR
jgi:hypothetical protein